MKRTLLIFFLTLIVFLPFNVKNVKAETWDIKDSNNYQKIDIYFFFGEGCPSCSQAKDFFNNLDEEYKSYYNLHFYEVWENDENNNLMHSMAKNLNETVTSVPYMIIEDKSIKGYTSTYDILIKNTIKEKYNKKNNIIPEETNLDTMVNDKDYEKNIKQMETIVYIIVFSAIAIGYYISYVVKNKKK